MTQKRTSVTIKLGTGDGRALAAAINAHVHSRPPLHDAATQWLAQREQARQEKEEEEQEALEAKRCAYCDEVLGVAPECECMQQIMNQERNNE